MGISTEEAEPQVANEASVEALWAQTCSTFAERHWLLVQNLQNDFEVTPLDDDIYAAFRAEFPDMKVDVVDEDCLKSDEGKIQWRAFLEGTIKESMADYSFGTLLRLDYRKPYSPDNTAVVTRGQFYAVEIARNRELSPVHGL